MFSFLIFILFLIPVVFYSSVFFVIYMLSFFFFFFFFGLGGFFFFFFFFFSVEEFFCMVSLFFGLDFVSFIFCILSVWIVILILCSMSISWLSGGLIYFNFLSLIVLLILISGFVTLDLIYFYFMYEVSLIPIVLMIFGWGYQPERLSAGFYMFFYTGFASMPLMVFLFICDYNLGGFSYVVTYNIEDKIVGIFLLFAFLVSFPVMFFHLWLPKAHVEAPVGGSMILAGVMLKLGGYGVFRLIDFLIDFFLSLSWFFFSVGLFTFFFMGIVCLVQSDLKILIAYSSVSHMGLVICGLFSLMSVGIFGSVLMMISHGLVSSGMFYFIGLLYDRFGTRSFFVIRGLLTCCPSLGLFGFVLSVSNLSFPLSVNMFSEVMIVFSTLSWSFFSFFGVFMGLFFSAVYSLFFFSFSFHGLNGGLFGFINVSVYEFMVLFFHLFPVYFIGLNLFYFF